MHQAQRSYKDLRDRRGSFLSSYNLGVYYSRMEMSGISKVFYSEAEGFAKESRELLMAYRALACSYSREERFEEAVNYIEKSLNSSDIGLGIEREITTTIAVDIYYRAGRVERALELAKSLEKSQINPEKERLHFELALMKVVSDKKRVGPKPSALKEGSEYERKWKILSSLQSGDEPEARKTWGTLRDSFPAKYGDAFEPACPSDKRSVFFSVLYSLRRQTVNKEEKVVLRGKSRELFSLLKESEFPLRKEVIIEKIWKIPYTPVLDSRFYKLVERTRSLGGLNIVLANQAYSLAR
jgi:tetratricopeptide (TPR) repeat protein